MLKSSPSTAAKPPAAYSDLPAAEEAETKPVRTDEHSKQQQQRRHPDQDIKDMQAALQQPQM